MQVMQNLRAGVRLTCFFLFTLLCIPFFAAERIRRMPRRVVGFWFRTSNRIFGIYSLVSGRASHDGPLLYVVNHVSYLDILALGAHLDAVFVAKRDIAGWPLLGRLAKTGQCIFISRRRVHLKSEIETIRSTLVSGRNVILFPEGTTGCGASLLPFKSSLLAAVEHIPGMCVQPVSIAYPDVANGGPDITLAWYGDMTLLPHLWRLLRRVCAPARIHFHPVLSAGAYCGRKTLAGVCRERIASGVGMLLMQTPEPQVNAHFDSQIWDQDTQWICLGESL